MQISFVGLLTLLFIGLKLTGHIMWSWWWVMSPLWISGIIWFIIFLVAVGLHAAADVKRKNK